MKKTLFLTFILLAGIGLAGCMTNDETSVEIMQQPTMEETMEAAELTPEEMETQAVSESDELETLERELDATVILEENLGEL